MMAAKDYSLDDLPLIRDAFTKCMKDLIEKTDFDVMYEELINTDIGKDRMHYVFVLRAEVRSEQSSQARSQELYSQIATKENGENFLHWFNAILLSLYRTGNQNSGKHQEVSDKISALILEDSLQDSKPENRLTVSRKVS